MSVVLRPKKAWFVLFLVWCSMSSPQAWSAPPQKPQTRERKTSTEPLTQTLILPIRYLQGSRMVSLLKIFVPIQEMRYTHFMYSPNIHKLLIRAKPEILEQLKVASQQLDVPQAQFWLQVYFLQPSQAAPTEESRQQHPDLFAYLAKTFPQIKHVSVVEHVYVRTTNHHLAELKATKRGTTYDPTLHITLHQGLPGDQLQVQLHLFHHESFQAVAQGKANTQFIKSTQLQTRFFVVPGEFATVGSASLRRNQSERTLVVIKVEPVTSHSSLNSVSQGNSGTSAQSASGTRPLGTLEKSQIRSVINANKNHFKACYTRALQTQPELKGRVVMSMSIQPTGHVSDAKIKSSTLRHARVEDCILVHVRQLKFPAPTGGGVVLVNYPLIFHPR